MKPIYIRIIVYFVLIAVILFSIFTLAIISWKNSCTETRNIDTLVSVKDIGERKIIGLNTDQDFLNFGTMSPGIIGKRSITITRNTSAFVRVDLAGKMADWMSVTPSPPLHLTTGTPQEINFEVNVPYSAAAGNYSGKIVLCFREE